MWILKTKIKHDCTIASRCQKFGCTSYSLSLGAWHDKHYEYTSQKHQIFGPKPYIYSFLADLRNDPRIYNLKVMDSEVYFVEKRLRKEIPSSFYNHNLFFIKPVFVDIYGFETWEIASRNKKNLQEFLTGIKKIKNAEVIVDYIKPYKIESSLEDLNNPNNIVKRTEGELDQRLVEQLRIGHIEGDQWFRDFQEWLVIAFNNPYNFKHSNSELLLLDKNQKEIFPLIKNHLQIHYGVGVGETELELIRWQLEVKNYAEIAAIDINQTFLELFLENLKNKRIEFPKSKIGFKGYYTTFQNTNFEDFNFKNSKFKRKVHICLGGTIGNFKNQSEIYSIFRRNCAKGDRLLLGFQLDSHIKQAFAKYKNNKYYPQFVLNYFDETINPAKIEWRLDTKSGFISMKYKGMEVFRTRKYKINNLAKELKIFGFKLENYWTDDYENSVIAIFEKLAFQ